MISLDIIRREITRGMAGARQAFRGVLGSLDRPKRVQLATLEGLNGEALQGMELFQHFGFTSAPPAGTQVIVLPLGGKTSAAILVASENGNYRLQLGADGEMAIYNQWGDHVWLKTGGVMEVVAATRVAITAPLVAISGDVTVGGTLTAAIDVLGGGKSLKSHTHSGVQPGGGSTGAPN